MRQSAGHEWDFGSRRDTKIETRLAGWSPEVSLFFSVSLLFFFFLSAFWQLGGRAGLMG